MDTFLSLPTWSGDEESACLGCCHENKRKLLSDLIQYKKNPAILQTDTKGIKGIHASEKQTSKSL